MTLIKIVYSVVITALIFFCIQVPSHWLYLTFLFIGICGLVSHYPSGLFLYLNISYAIFVTFYAPINTLSLSLFPQIQPKIISVFLITFVLSFLGRAFLYRKRVEWNSGKWLNVILLISLIILFFQINEILSYSSLALFLVMVSISYAILDISSFTIVYDYKKKHAVIALVIFILLPFLNFIQLENPPKIIGVVRHHSVWAEDEVPYDPNDWTIKSNYSYSEFSEILSNKYNAIDIDSEEEMRDALRHCDGVIIMTPTIPFTSREKTYLKQYLDLKGKIIIIGDHTDLYGHGRVLNDLIERSGISINYDALFSPTTWYGEVQFRNTLFGNVRPLTAASISVKKPAYVMAWSSNWISEAADYSAPNFFGNLTWTADDQVVDYPLAVTVKAGKGHITLWSDSTMFSNFALYQPRAIQTIDHLINHGGYLSSLTHYYSFLIFILLTLLFCVSKHRSILLIFIFFISSLTGGLYLIYPIKTDEYYNPKSRIDIFCNEDIIRESPPNKNPLPFTLSNLYSNIARYDLQPNWISGNPSKCLPKQNCIWVTTSKTFTSWKGYKPKRIVLIDDYKDMEKLGYKRTYVETGPAFLDIATDFNRRHWIHPTSKHTFILDGSYIFASDGVLDDRTIGNWWAGIEVSLYRKEMMKKFIAWITEGTEIAAFQYPKLGVVEGRKSARLVQSGKENKSLEKIDFNLLEYGKDEYIYLGGEMWGLFNKNQDGNFIVGGPETSDNYLKYKNSRFLISIVEVPRER